MVEIYREALNHLWQPFDSSLTGTTNQTLSCSELTPRLPNDCAYQLLDGLNSELINSKTNNTAFATIFDANAGIVVGSITTNILYILKKVLLLFYLVWPTEIMFSSLDQVPRYVAEMFPVFFVASIVENMVRMLQGRNLIRVNETVCSLSQGIFQECLRIHVRSIELIMYCIVWENFRIIALPWNSLWTWWCCYLAVDFGFYWAHRLAHEVNFIWAVHQAHHSSEEFSFVSALRQAVLQPFTAWVFLAHFQLSELYMVWLHTEIIDNIGPLEYILNTPSHHRVHHSRNPEYIDKNYGGMLIIWDRLFNTFKSEDKNNPPVYGLVHPVRSFNPIRVQFHPWPIIWRRIKRAETIWHKLGVIFYGPGWRPGSPRLGNSAELPPIIRPVNCYNPFLMFWLNVYVVSHFGLLLLFYHELTMFQSTFQPIILNAGTLGLLASITSLGFTLDNKYRYSAIFELTRCLAFFQIRKYIEPIILHGFERAGINLHHKTILISIIYLVFALSSMISALRLTWQLWKTSNISRPTSSQKPLKFDK